VLRQCGQRYAIYCAFGRHKEIAVQQHEKLLRRREDRPGRHPYCTDGSVEVMKKDHVQRAGPCACGLERRKNVIEGGRIGGDYLAATAEPR